MRLIAFIGPSGTGKSHRALWVAHENHVEYLIDDGLLIHENGIVAGRSAKKAPTRIGSVKIALFHDAAHRAEIRAAIDNRKPEGILILGTSDGMVEKIVHALGLGEITERVYIHEVASEFEIEQARTTRLKQGKHVIPVPATELKKQFSGFFLDPLQLFRRQGKGSFQHIGEKSVVRPTFSYFGKYTISDMAIYQVVSHLLLAMPGMDKITRFRTSNTPEGLILDMDVIMVFGHSIVETTREAQQNIIQQLDRFAGLQVMRIQIHVKTLSMNKTVLA